MLRLRDYREGSSLLFSPWNVGVRRRLRTHAYTLEKARLDSLGCEFLNNNSQSSKLLHLLSKLYIPTPTTPRGRLQNNIRNMFDNSKVCVKKFERSFAKLRERKVRRKYFFYFSACLRRTRRKLFSCRSSS